MSANQNVPPLGPVPVEETVVSKKAKPTRTLPTERINTSKQLDILRAYAAASANGTKAATITEVGEIVKMAPTTVSMANAFLSSIGLITRTDAGSYSPSSEALSFLRAYEWNPETAAQKLGSVLRESWFGQVIVPRVTFGPIDEEAAITALAEASSAGTEYRKELKILIDYLVSGGVVIRDGGQIRGTKQPDKETPAPAKPEQPAETREPSISASSVRTAFAQPQSGGFNLNIQIQVDMTEFATWRPDRIQAFFRGVAEVLAAKADVEKGGTQS